MYPTANTRSTARIPSTTNMTEATHVHIRQQHITFFSNLPNLRQQICINSILDLEKYMCQVSMDFYSCTIQKYNILNEARLHLCKCLLLMNQFIRNLNLRMKKIISRNWFVSNRQSHCAHDTDRIKTKDNFLNYNNLRFIL